MMSSVALKAQIQRLSCLVIQTFLMGKSRFSPSLLMSTLLVLIPVSESNVLGFHPLCMSQFALATHACSSISFGPMPHSSVPASSVLASSSSSSSSLVPLPGFDNLYRGHHKHHHDHDDDHDRDHGGHKHHRHHHHEALAAKECCRWLQSIDNICICDLLLRLPVFLSRPIHGYKVVVDDECRIEYACPGRLMTEP